MSYHASDCGLAELSGGVATSQKGQKTKQAYAVTDDEDSLKVYGGTKLLDGSGNGAGPRKRNKNGDNQLIDVNAGINTDSDSDRLGKIYLSDCHSKPQVRDLTEKRKNDGLREIN